MTQGLGMLKDGIAKNNWKMALVNFFLIFSAQMVFNLLGMFVTPDVWPTPWFVCQATLSSLAVTLIFYGYNKTKQTDEVVIA